MQRFEEDIHLLRDEHRRRLIQDQDAGIAVEGFQDFDSLALPD